MKRNGACIHAKQAGNALVEFAVIAGVLTPMLVLMPSLAKTTDINLSSSQAARYGAWEQTVQAKEGSKLATEMTNRFYAAPEIGIRTNRGALTSSDEQNPFWSATGLNGAMLTTGDDTLSVSVSKNGLGGGAGEIEKIVADLGDILGTVSGHKWDLGGKGLYTVNVGVVLKNEQIMQGDGIGENCQGMASEAATCMRQKSAILVDTWGASGPKHVEKRVKALVPAGGLEKIGNSLAVIGKTLPIFAELEKLEDAFGAVEPDVLPLDRFGEENKN